MNTSEIILEIEKLSLTDKLMIAENILKTVQKESSTDKRMAEAAKILLDEYQNNIELTEFTSLDAEESMIPFCEK